MSDADLEALVYVSPRELAQEIIARGRRIAALEAEVTEYAAEFDLYARAQQRGVEAWRAAHPGNALVSPGTGRLTTWLLDQVADLRARIAELETTLRQLEDASIAAAYKAAQP